MRAGVSSSSNPFLIIYDRLCYEVISITDDFDSKRISLGSLDKGDYSRDSCYDALFCYDDVEGDHVAASMPHSSHAAGASVSPDCMTPEMEASLLNMKDVKDYSKAYPKAYGWDPSAFDLKDHLEHGAQPNGVSWVTPFDIFKVNELSPKGTTLVKLNDLIKYDLVDVEIAGTPCNFTYSGGRKRNQHRGRSSL